MIGKTRFSAFVITKDEEINIRECLETMKWVDEIVVVDSGSSDATLQIAREYTDRIIERPLTGFVDQMEYARAHCTGDWILWLDADERLSEEARAEAARRFEMPDGPGCDAFAFPRKTWFLGRWIVHSGWYPQHRTRLFRADRSRIVGDEPHTSARIEGVTHKLTGDILHLSYRGGFVDMVNRSAKYAAIAARARYEKGRRFSLLRLLFRPPLDFMKKFFLQRGFLDGLPGLGIAVGAGYYRFVREMVLWELQHGCAAAPPGDSSEGQ